MGGRGGFARDWMGDVGQEEFLIEMPRENKEEPTMQMQQSNGEKKEKEESSGGKGD